MRRLGFLGRQDAGAASDGMLLSGGVEFARPEPGEKIFVKRSGEYARLWGREKRIRMLRDAYDDCTAQLAQLRNRAGEPDLGAIAALEEKRADIGKESRIAAQKLVIEDSVTTDILAFGKAAFHKQPSGVQEVLLPVTVKEGTLADGTVIDGVIMAEVRCGDVFVSNVLLPLPVTGMGAGKWQLKGFCIRSLPGNSVYELRIGDRQKLWVMER